MHEKIDVFGGPLILAPEVFRDHRGSFFETFNVDRFRSLIGREINFIDEVHSISTHKSVVRGLHFQYPPKAKEKLVRVIRGAILDVGLDIRPQSPTFGRYFSVELSEENRKQVFLPKGFAHGYRCLTEHTEVLYRSTEYFDPQLAAGLRWDDPFAAIEWGVEAQTIVLSDYDKNLPALEEISPTFVERPPV